jgi:hypothetical protein
MVESRIRACDGLATTDQCVRCVKGVTWAKAGSRHQRPRPLDYGTISELQLQGKRVHCAPGARKTTPHSPHHRLGVRSVLRERILDAIVAQPGEDQPVGELVEDQGADHPAVDRHLSEHSATPVLKRLRCLRAL